MEVLEAIKVLKGGGAAGPDGYCREFYKTGEHLSWSSYEKGHLPTTLNLVNSPLILKKGKTPHLCFSLILVESKLLSKLFAGGWNCFLLILSILTKQDLFMDAAQLQMLDGC